MRRADVVTEARRWIGTPYVHQGRTQWGVDCIGLIICVRDALEPWPAARLESTDYPRQIAAGVLEDRIAAHCTRIDSPEDGCVILIRWRAAKHATHAAIYAGGNMIHSYLSARAVVETGYRSFWLRFTQSLWRLPGVEQ